MRLILALFFFCFVMELDAQQKVTFPSLDGLQVTGDMYVGASTAPVILLCHQARFSRGEYIETAKKLVALGFNCFAIDQRSGDQVNGVQNETAIGARKAGKATEYLDAEQDILAALAYIKSKSSHSIILLGSSYSASLVLKIGSEREEVKAVVAFSPGEYFGEKLKIQPLLSKMDKPVFLTSSLKEAPAVKELVSEIPAQWLNQFIPPFEGQHGSKALWKENSGYEAYWVAFQAFLQKQR